MSDFMLGFTSTTFRQLEIDKIIILAKISGADCIEWGGDIHVTNVQTANVTSSKCSNEGIIISSYGSYYRVGENNASKWEEICEISAALGARTVRVWLGTLGSKITSEERYFNILLDAQKIADKAKEYNLIVAPECHANTYNDSLESSLRFLREVERDNVKTYFQSRYQNMEKDLERLRQTFPYIENVHLSFSEVNRMRFFMRRDNTCVPRIMEEIKKTSFNGAILLEYVLWANPHNYLKDMKKLKILAGRE